jgi:lactate racemase
MVKFCPMNQKIKLLYGRDNLEIDLPKNATVIRPQFLPGFIDEKAEIKKALRQPIGTRSLKEKVKAGDKVVVSHSDHTRATPNSRLLPVILDELESAGVSKQAITLLNALGTHRKCTLDEMRELLGDYLVDHYHCVQHDAFDEASLVSIGTTSRGNPVRVNRLLVENDVRIYTGYIEPHLFAGFSGGPKSVLPALAGAESVSTNHSREMLSHKNATWGITKGNPIWEEMREAALLTNPTFLVNVTLNNQKQITGVFAGNLILAHQAGCDFTRTSSMVPVDRFFDVVVTTNSGYPLDRNLYQSIKGLSAASRIVRSGGAILLVAACEDGMPAKSHYADMLRSVNSAQEALDMIYTPGFTRPEQWQIQIQAQIQLCADVYLYSTGLEEDEIKQALFMPVKDLSITIRELMDEYGKNICVMPEGPLTIPYLKDS